MQPLGSILYEEHTSKTFVIFINTLYGDTKKGALLKASPYQA